MSFVGTGIKSLNHCAYHLIACKGYHHKYVRRSFVSFLWWLSAYIANAHACYYVFSYQGWRLSTIVPLCRFFALKYAADAACTVLRVDQVTDVSIPFLWPWFFCFVFPTILFAGLSFFFPLAFLFCAAALLVMPTENDTWYILADHNGKTSRWPKKRSTSWNGWGLVCALVI